MQTIDADTIKLIGDIVEQESWRQVRLLQKRSLWSLQRCDLAQCAWTAILSTPGLMASGDSSSINTKKLRGIARRGILDELRNTSPGKRNKALRDSVTICDIEKLKAVLVEGCYFGTRSEEQAGYRVRERAKRKAAAA